MMENMDDNEYMGMSENDEEDAKDMITLSGDFAEKIWVPDTFFANDKNRWVVMATESINLKLIKQIFIKVSYTMWRREINWCGWQGTVLLLTECDLPPL